MILYLDTSAIVKLYAAETGRAQTKRLVAAAKQVASAVVAYAETRAALARKYRMRQISEEEFSRYKNEFEADWTGFLRLAVDAQLARAAGEFAERFGLRAYDSLHLASAAHLLSETRSPISFASFDSALNTAASGIGLTVPTG